MVRFTGTVISFVGTSAKFSPRQQVQNFPQLVIKLMVAGSNLSWQGIERKGSVH